MVNDVPMTRRNLLQSLGGIVALAALSGCSMFQRPEPVKMADLTGLWRSEDPENRSTTLDLRADGKFEWARVPAETFASPASTAKLNWDIRTTFQGTWSTKRKSSGSWSAFLDIPGVAGSLSFGIEGRGSDQTIHHYLGDPDMYDGFVFYRQR